MHTLSVTLFIAFVFAASADLEINGADKLGGNAGILNSNSSVNENIERKNTDREKNVYLENNDSSNQIKSKEDRGQREVNNGSDNISKSTEVGEQNNVNDNNPRKGDGKEGLKEAEGANKRNDGGSGGGGLKEKIKEAEQQEKGNGTGSEKHGDKDKILQDGFRSKEQMLPKRKESFHGEECDSSYSCTIEESAVVACLRVPGNESPDLSLLVQNKGKSSVSVSILAPKFVQLEINKIELQGKENKKMKVSIGIVENDNVIILKAGDGKCALDFRGLIDNDDKAAQFKYSFPSLGIMCLLAIALVATILIYIKRRLAVVSDGHKYQKLDMNLPVSGGGQTETISNDGWDNSWDDNWDDVEAPKTPSLPISPLISSKSFSSRRSSKEGWND